MKALWRPRNKISLGEYSSLMALQLKIN